MNYGKDRAASPLKAIAREDLGLARWRGGHRSPRATGCAVILARLMVELLLILLGGRGVRRGWWLIGLVGLAWGSLGVFFFINGLNDESRLHPVYFAIPLAIESTLSLIAALGVAGSVRLLRVGQGAGLLALTLLILLYPWHGGLLIGFLFGSMLVIDAGWRAVSAHIVRYPGWRLSLSYAALEFAGGCWSFIPWPTHWRGEVAYDVATWLTVTAVGICAVALRLRQLPAGKSVAALFTRGWPADETPVTEPGGRFARAGRCDATVHVWTPTGRLVSVNRSLSRYIAAVDAKGNVSTGHAALEAPGLYISHYPATDLDRSKVDFRKILRATRDNDVQGRFLTSYEAEVADWQPSTLRVTIKNLNAQGLGTFWAAYRRDATYNLTDRNCSTAVAKALDAGLEGIFEAHGRSLSFLARLFMAPELRLAGFLRHRAAAMTWTPGLVLDYARALSILTALPERSWDRRNEARGAGKQNVSG